MASRARCFVCEWSTEGEHARALGPESRCPGCGAKGSLRWSGPAPAVNEEARRERERETANRVLARAPTVPALMRSLEDALGR